VVSDPSHLLPLNVSVYEQVHKNGVPGHHTIAILYSAPLNYCNQLLLLRNVNMRLDIEELATLWDIVAGRGIRKAIAKKEKALQEQREEIEKEREKGAHSTLLESLRG
jgi:hypothetical protein